MSYVLWDVSLSTNAESWQDFTCTVLMLSSNVFVPVGCGKIQFWIALGNVLLKPVLFVCANGFYVLLEQSLHELFLNVAININATKKHLPLIFVWFVSFHERISHWTVWKILTEYHAVHSRLGENAYLCQYQGWT